MIEKNEVSELLDKACVDALGTWWATHNKTPHKERALESMRELQKKLYSFQKPNYDSEYTLSAYVVIYQIKHIYMVWQALHSLRRERNIGASSQDSLRIVDFGAGASAGRIGAALMMAKAIDDGIHIDHIYLDEIDISRPMLKMGDLIWQAFVERVRAEHGDTPLECAVNAIDSCQHTSWQTVGERRDCETWLTAFHVIYQDQSLRGLKKIISKLNERVNPMAGAFSCYESRGRSYGDQNRLLMEEIFPPFLNRSPSSAYYMDQKCPSDHISNWALEYGFITEDEYDRGWRPFVHVRDSALLYGYNSPL